MKMNWMRKPGRIITARQIKLSKLIILFFVLVGCTKSDQKYFLFDDTNYITDSFKVKFYNEYDYRKTYFTIKDSLIIDKIHRSLGEHSKKDYVKYIPANYANSFYDFKVIQNNREFLISTGLIKEPGKGKRGYVDILRKEDRGYITEGSFYCDTIFRVLKNYKKTH